MSLSAQSQAQEPTWSGRCRRAFAPAERRHVPWTIPTDMLAGDEQTWLNTVGSLRRRALKASGIGCRAVTSSQARRD